MSEEKKPILEVNLIGDQLEINILFNPGTPLFSFAMQKLHRQIDKMLDAQEHTAPPPPKSVIIPSDALDKIRRRMG